MRRLVLMRHGESETNRANQFTGNLDPPLTPRGRAQADAAGAYLRAHGITPDVVFASPLLRTVTSCARVLTVLGRPNRRILACDALIERDYGMLSSLNKAEAEARWGTLLVEHWRRSYVGAPPAGESLRDTVARVVPAYLRLIQPAVMQGTVLVVAHGNSLRALIMALEGLSPAEVEDLELPTGTVRIYDLHADTTIATRTLLEVPAPPALPCVPLKAPEHSSRWWLWRRSADGAGPMSRMLLYVAVLNTAALSLIWLVTV